MSADDTIAIARLEQEVHDHMKTVDAFMCEIRAWRLGIDAERNKLKGAVVVAGLGGGGVGAVLAWLGKIASLKL